MRTVEIDGARGEGGGQILRSSLTLSLLTGKPLHLINIRARRSKPGLRPQHLKSVQAAAEIGEARTQGAALGSTELVFEPGQVRPGDYLFDIGTAGATSLLLQTVYLPLALADSPSTVTAKGGTHVPMSPCFHYLDLHWRKFLAASGLELDLHMERAGFYPPGGGMIRLSIPPVTGIKPLELRARGRPERIRGLSAVADLDESIAERQRDRTLKRLGRYADLCDIRIEHLDAPSKGTVLLLLAEFEHTQTCFFGLGARGKPAERVADEAIDELLAFLKTEAAVDRYLADQLLLPLAVVTGESVISTSEITRHLLTNAEVIRRFLPIDVTIKGSPEEPGTVHIRP